MSTDFTEREETGTMATKQILSPLPGTFYRRPAPDKPTYKEPGDAVAVGDALGLVEVMKTFYEVKVRRRRQGDEVPGRATRRRSRPAKRSPRSRCERVTRRAATEGRRPAARCAGRAPSRP